MTIYIVIAEMILYEFSDETGANFGQKSAVINWTVYLIFSF